MINRTLSKMEFSYFLFLFMLGLSSTSLYAEDVSNPVNVGVIETASSSKEDWIGLNYFPVDEIDDIPSSKSERINWKVATMADDKFNLFIYFENHNLNINPERNNGSLLNFSWGYQVFLDTDDSAGTGFQLSNVVGADYLVEGNVLMKYEGQGSNWKWSTIGSLPSNYYGKEVEYKISRVMLGNPQRVKVVFQGSNQSFDGQTTDLYPNGAFDEDATTRYFSYQLADSQEIGQNTPPELNDLEFIIPKNNLIRGFSLQGTDADDQFLTYEVITEPENGSFYIQRFGTIDYVLFYAPNQGFTGQDTFTYRASDSIDQSRIATVTFNIYEDNSIDSYSNIVGDKSMKIDANLNEWADVTAFPDLPYSYQSTTGPNWLNASVAHSNDHLYFSYRNRHSIVADEVSGTYIPWNYQVYIDTDQNESTGYLESDVIGADYLVEGNYLFFYNGSGTDWSWQMISALEASFIGSNAEIKVPRELINFTKSNFNMVLNGNTGTQIVVRYPNTRNHYFEYNIGAGVTAPEMKIAKTQEGLDISPLHHQPVLSRPTEENVNSSSGGGLINYGFMLFVVALLVTRRKVKTYF